MKPVALAAILLAPGLARAEDWTAWGRTMQRNMVASEKKVPKLFDPGRFVAGTEQVDLATTRGVRWVAKLGSQTYGNPTVADGRVFLGTNNEAALRPGLDGDRSVVLALDEQSGELLWQLTVPKLGSGKVNDWEYLGICSSPTVIGDVVYVVTNRGEVVALDVHGLANGNDGMQDEGAFMAAPGSPPVDLLPMDADILWSFNMPDELGVFPHNITSSSALVVGDALYVSTSNGVDWSHIDLPSPFAPALVALDRNTGALLGEEAVGISERTFHANWSTPMYVPAAQGLPGQVVFGAGDGFLYGFEVEPVMEDGLRVLKERWRYDANPPEYRERDGQKLEYATYDGPSELIGTPVFAEGRIYATIGQDPEHGSGVGQLSALAPTIAGDVSGHALWTFKDIGRSISTPAVYKGLVFLPDFDGVLYCLSAATGELLWKHPTGAHIWGSPLVAGGYVFLGNEDGELHVLKASKKLQPVQEIALPAPIYSSPILSGGVLYVATQTHLYAVDGLP
ncbi:MAG TPA: PQQ-binding-like beta-propeller repeat protein [Myxococcota bacterium]|nr:PQQ-binding-like beta-propeller repeat protein [Myxococcota bacterium]